MADGKLTRALTLIRAADGGVSDSQLLERFAGSGDEAAFELLVWRHSRLVLGVCRRVLRDSHDADDAFQATFLALARKAGSISHRAALPGWLYTVAHRIALNARADRSRRASRQRPLAAAEEVATPSSDSAPEQGDVRAILDEEVSRLPERFRVPAILCYLEGKSVAEAAVQLGCPRGTVASRLARARQRLRGRLARRGLAGTAGLLPVLARSGTAAPALIRATARAALPFATGQSVLAGIISTRAAALTEEVLKGMLLKKLKVGVAVVMALAGVLAGGGLAWNSRGEAPVAFPLVRADEADRPPQPRAGESAQEAQAGAAVPSVTVARPVRRNAVPYEEFLGRIQPASTIQIRSRVGGTVEKTPPRTGVEVKKGDILFEIDTRAHLANLVQAEGRLAQADAVRKQAAANLERLQTPAKDSGKAPNPAVVTQARADVATAEGAWKQAQAGVKEARAVLKACQVRAPADGTLVEVRIPQSRALLIADAEEFVLAQLVPFDPLGHRFDMDERNYLRYQRLIRAGEAPKTGAPLQIGLADEEGYPHKGSLVGFGTKFDPDKGTINVFGTVANPDRLLLPGMSARVRMPFGKARPVLEIPEAAICTDGKHYVLVVNDRNIVERRDVKWFGESRGDLRVVEAGLQPDDWVVIRSATDLHPGDRVQPRREVLRQKPGK
jgi:RND family efflux transporter MFP subunit